MKAFNSWKLNVRALLFLIGMVLTSALANQPPTSPTVTPKGLTGSGPFNLVAKMLALEANANDPDGKADIVETVILLNGQGYTNTTCPFDLTVGPLPTGNYTAKAIFTDSAAHVVFSSTITINFRANQPPAKPTITPNGLTGSGPFSVLGPQFDATATSIDPDGALDIVSAVILLDGVGRTNTSFPFNTTYNPVVAGPHTLQAIATDSVGNVAIGDVVTVNVKDNLPPTVNLLGITRTDAAHWTTIANTTNLVLSAQATAPADEAANWGDSVTGIHFTLTTEPPTTTIDIGTATTPTPNTTDIFTYTWAFDPTTLKGNTLYRLSAIATDSIGATTTDSTDFKVVPNTFPSIFPTGPIPGAEYLVDAAGKTTLHITGTATDDTGITAIKVSITPTTHLLNYTTGIATIDNPASPTGIPEVKNPTNSWHLELNPVGTPSGPETLNISIAATDQNRTVTTTNFSIVVIQAAAIRQIQPLNGHSATTINDANANGAIVGQSSGNDATARAFIWTKDRGTVELVAPGTYGNALAINLNTEVVGQGTRPTGEVVPAYWSPAGQMQELTTISDDTAKAVGISQNGTIVGIQGGDGLLWDNHQTIPNYISILPNGISAQGHVIFGFTGESEDDLGSPAILINDASAPIALAATGSLTNGQVLAATETIDASGNITVNACGYLLNATGNQVPTTWIIQVTAGDHTTGTVTTHQGTGMGQYSGWNNGNLVGSTQTTTGTAAFVGNSTLPTTAAEPTQAWTLKDVQGSTAPGQIAGNGSFLSQLRGYYITYNTDAIPLPKGSVSTTSATTQTAPGKLDLAVNNTWDVQNPLGPTVYLAANQTQISKNPPAGNFTSTWNGVPADSYTIYAILEDQYGQDRVTTSFPITINPTAGTTYRVIALAPSSDFQALGFNNKGDVVGTSNGVAQYWNGTFETMEAITADSASLTGINDSEVMSANLTTGDQTYSAQVAPDGTVTMLPLGANAGTVDYTLGINAAGTVFGIINSVNGTYQTYTWATNAPVRQILPSLAANGATIAAAMDDSSPSVFVGNTTAANGRQYAFAYQNTLTLLPDGTANGPANASAINNSGWIAGSVGQNNPIPALWTPNAGSYTLNHLPLVPGAVNGIVTAINNEAVPLLVGTQNRPDDSTIGVISSPTTTQPLNGLLARTDAHWNITSALFINNDETILAKATDSTLGEYFVMLIKETYLTNNTPPVITLNAPIPKTAINSLRFQLQLNDDGYGKRITRVSILQYQNGATATVYTHNFLTPTNAVNLDISLNIPISGSFNYQVLAYDNLGAVGSWPPNTVGNPQLGSQVNVTYRDSTPQLVVQEIGTHVTPSDPRTGILVANAAFPSAGTFSMVVTNITPLGINNAGDFFGTLRANQTFTFPNNNLTAAAGSDIPYMTINKTVYIIGLPDMTGITKYSGPTNMIPMAMNSANVVEGQVTVYMGSGVDTILTAKTAKASITAAAGDDPGYGTIATIIFASADGLTNGTIVSIDGMPWGELNVSLVPITAVNASTLTYTINPTPLRALAAATTGQVTRVGKTKRVLGFLAQNGQKTILRGPMYGGNYLYPADITDNGFTSGYGNYGMGANQADVAYVEYNNSFSPLPDPELTDPGSNGRSYSYGMNRYGDIAGYYEDYNQTTNDSVSEIYYPTVWLAPTANFLTNYDTPVVLGTAGTIFQPTDKRTAVKVNDLGETMVVGYTTIKGINYVSLYVQNALQNPIVTKAITNVALLNGVVAFQPFDFNNRGQIVARLVSQIAGTTNFQNTGILFDNGHVYNIANLATNAGVQLTTSIALNDLGQIAAGGVHLIGTTPQPAIQSFLLTQPYILEIASASVNANEGHNLDCKMNVYNYSGATFPGACITLTLPLGTTLVSATPQPDLVNGAYTWSGLSLNPGTTTPIQFTIASDVQAGGRIILNNSKLTVGSFSTPASPLTRAVLGSPQITVVHPSTTELTPNLNTSVPITATAQSGNGQVNFMSAAFDGVVFHRTSSDVLQAFKTVTSVGQHTLLIKATDIAGITSQTNITFTVYQPGQNPSPVANLTIKYRGQPITATTFTDPNYFSLVASATDDRSLTNLSILINDVTFAGSSFASCTNNTLSINWVNMEAGQYNLKAAAMDASGNIAFSANPLSLTINRSGTPPANDDIENAISIQAPDGKRFLELTNLSNVNATWQLGEPAHGNRPSYSSVWFTWVAPTSADTTVWANTTNFDSVLAIYTNNPTADNSNVALTNLVPIVANDDAGTGIGSLATFQSVGGLTYYIAVSGYGDNWGTFDLGVSQTEAPVVKLISPANGDNFHAGDTVTLVAKATDPDGTIASVTFYDGNQAIASATPADKYNPVPVSDSTTFLDLLAEEQPMTTDQTWLGMAQGFRPGPKINNNGIVSFTRQVGNIADPTTPGPLEAYVTDANGASIALPAPPISTKIWSGLPEIKTALDVAKYNATQTIYGQANFELPGLNLEETRAIVIDPTTGMLLQNPDRPATNVPAIDSSLEHSGYVVEGYIYAPAQTNVYLFLRADEGARLEVDGNPIATFTGPPTIRGTMPHQLQTYADGWQWGYTWYQKGTALKKGPTTHKPTPWKNNVAITDITSDLTNNNLANIRPRVPVKTVDSQNNDLGFYALLPSGMQEFTTYNTITTEGDRNPRYYGPGPSTTPAGPNYSGYTVVRKVTLTPGVHRLTLRYYANSMHLITATYSPTGWGGYGTKKQVNIWMRQDFMVYSSYDMGRWYPISTSLYRFDYHSGSAGVDDNNNVAVNYAGNNAPANGNWVTASVASPKKNGVNAPTLIQNGSWNYVNSINRTGYRIGWTGYKTMATTGHNTLTTPMGIPPKTFTEYPITTLQHAIGISISDNGQFALLAGYDNNHITALYRVTLTADPKAWATQTPVQLTAPSGATDVLAYQVNVWGSIAGSAKISGQWTPVLWTSPENPQLLIPGTTGEALTINVKGDVGGYLGNTSSPQAFLKLADGALQKIGDNINKSPAISQLLTVTDINDNRAFTGHAQTASGISVYTCTLDTITSALSDTYDTVISSLEPGTHQIHVVAVDNDGATTTTLPITVTTKPKPVYTLIPLPNTAGGTAGAAVTINNQNIAGGYASLNSDPYSSHDTPKTHQAMLWQVGETNAVAYPTTSGNYELHGITDPRLVNGALVQGIIGNSFNGTSQVGFYQTLAVADGAQPTSTTIANLNYNLNCINLWGEIVGDQPNLGANNPAVFDANGNWTFLGTTKPNFAATAQNPYGSVLAINNNETMAGFAYESTTDPKRTVATIWTNSTSDSTYPVQILGDLASSFWSGINDINNNGIAAGWYIFRNSTVTTPQPTLITTANGNQGFLPLATRQYTGGRSKAINQFGQTAGYLLNQNSTEVIPTQREGYANNATGTLWENNSVYDLNFLVDDELSTNVSIITAQGINDQGVIVGMYRPTPQSGPQAMAMVPRVGVRIASDLTTVHTTNVITYTITAYNHSPEDLPNGEVQVQLPTGTTFVDAPEYSYSIDDTLIWTIDNLPLNSEISFSLMVQVTKPYNTSGKYTSTPSGIFPSEVENTGIANNVVALSNYGIKFRGTPTFHGAPHRILQENSAPTVEFQSPLPGTPFTITNTTGSITIPATIYFNDSDFDEAYKTFGSPIFDPNLIPTITVDCAKLVPGQSLPDPAGDLAPVFASAQDLSSKTLAVTDFPAGNQTNTTYRAYHITTTETGATGISIDNITATSLQSGVYIARVVATDHFGASATNFATFVINTPPAAESLTVNSGGAIDQITPWPSLIQNNIPTYMAGSSVQIQAAAWPAIQGDNEPGPEQDPVMATLDQIQGMGLAWEKLRVIITDEIYNGSFENASLGSPTYWVYEKNANATLITANGQKALQLTATAAAPSGWVRNKAALRDNNHRFSLTAWSDQPGTTLLISLGDDTDPISINLTASPQTYLLDGMATSTNTFGLNAKAAALVSQAHAYVDNVNLFEVEQNGEEPMLVSDQVGPNATYTGTLNWSPGAGTYYIAVTAYDAFAGQTVGDGTLIRFSITPSVSIIDPQGNAVLNIPSDGTPGNQNITFTVSTPDEDAYIDHVTMFDDTTPLFTYSGLNTTTTNITYTLSSARSHTYTITAQAWNNEGISGVSKPITIIANFIPSGRLIDPPGPYLHVEPKGQPPKNIDFTVSAQDRDGTITNAVFTLNGTDFANIAPPNSTAGQTVSVTASTPINTDQQQQIFTGRVIDNLGTPGQIPPVTFTVNRKPFVKITTPANDTTNLSHVDIPLTVYAADDDAPADRVAKLTFMANQTVLGIQQPKAPSSDGTYTFTWPNALAGDYQMTVIAEDTRGGTFTSAPIHFVVNTPPQVTWTSPVNGARFYGIASLALTANASDIDNNLDHIDFDTSNPILGQARIAKSDPLSQTATWINPKPGLYQISVTAYDKLGGIATNYITISIGPDKSYYILTPDQTNDTSIVGLNSQDIGTGWISQPSQADTVLLWDGVFSLANGINNSARPIGITESGAIAGNWLNGSRVEPFFWYAGTATSLPADLLDQTTGAHVAWISPNGINAVGQVQTTTGVTAAEWSPQTAKGQILSQVPINSTANWADDNGDIAGGVVDPQGTLRPFSIFVGRYALNTTGTGQAIAATPQADLLVSSDAELNPDPKTNPGAELLFNGQTLTISNQLNNVAVRAFSMNSSRYIVGRILDNSNPEAFLWINGAEFTMNELVQNGGDWTIIEATRITDQGRVIAKAVKAGQTNTVVIMPPGWSNKSPQVAWTTPNANANFLPTDVITLAVNAVDPDGFIKRVDFYIGTTLMGSTNTPDKNQNFWFSIPAGSPIGRYNATAIAYDKYGFSTATPIRNFTVDHPPVAHIQKTGVVNGVSLFQEGQFITLHTQTSDSDTGTGGAVGLVTYYFSDDGSKFANLAAGDPLFTMSRQFNIYGTWTVTAVATDDLGVSSSTTDPDAIWTMRINAHPKVSILTPANNLVLRNPTPLTITATASDNRDNDGVSTVEVLIDGVSAGISNYDNSPISVAFATTLTFIPAGTHTITVQATDSVGGVGAANITVTLNNPPVVQLIEPAEGATNLQENGSITITAVAYDPANGTTPGNLTSVYARLIDPAEGLDNSYYMNRSGSDQSGNPTWQTTLSGIRGGDYQVIVTGTDNYSAIAAATNHAHVNYLPTIYVSKPANNSRVQLPDSTISFSVQVKDKDGNLPVQLVNITEPNGANTTLSANADKITYQFTATNTLTAGNHNFTITAVDAFNGTNTAKVTIFANQSPITTAPTAELENSTNGPATLFSEPINGALNLVLKTTATNPDTGPADITRVDFYATDTNSQALLVASSTTKSVVNTIASFQATWTNALPGTWSLTAVVQDAQGAISTNNPSTTIQIIPAPGIFVQKPLQNTVLPTGTPLGIQVQVTPPQGQIFDHGTITVVQGTNGATLINIPFTQETITVPPMDTTALDAGLYSIQVTVTLMDTNSNDTVEVGPAISTFWFDDAPNITISVPNTVNLPLANPVTISATATDSDPLNVQRIEIYADDALLATRQPATPQATYTATTTWTPPANAASSTIKVIAYDSANLTQTKTAIVTLNQRPTLTFTTPTSGANYSSQASINYQLAATSSDDNLTTLTLTMDGAAYLVANGPASQLTINTTKPAPTTGTHTLVATATDVRGGTTSITNSIQVVAPPTIAISAPLNNTLIQLNETISIYAPASDDFGISRVDFYMNGVKFATDTTGRFRTTWIGTQNGNYTLTAVAVNTLGISTTSTPITINVNQPPTVTMLKPTDAQVFQCADGTTSASVGLEATAQDNNNNSIARVDYYMDLSDSPLTPNGAPTANNFHVDYQVPAGRHTIYAQAQDVNQGISRSTARTIIVNQKPTATISYPADGTPVAETNALSLEIQTSDPDVQVGDSVQGVILYLADGTLVGSAAPIAAKPGYFGYTWNNFGIGAKQVYTVCWDNYGGTNSTVTAPSTVAMTAAPVIRYLNLTDGQVVDSRQPMDARLLVTDADGSIQSVKLLVNGTPVDTRANAVLINGDTGNGNFETTASGGAPTSWLLAGTPFSTTKTTTEIYANHTTAKVTCAPNATASLKKSKTMTAGHSYALSLAGRTVNDGTATVEIHIGDSTTTVQLTAAYQIFQAAATLPQNATSTDLEIRAIAKASGATILIDNVVLAETPTDAGSPNTYTFDWAWSTTFPITRITTLETIATDNNGVTTHQTITLNNNLPPTVAIKQPATNADGVIIANSLPVTFTANAQDPDGRIQSVAYYLSDTHYTPGSQTLIGTSSSATDYSVNWNGNYGSYGLTLQATDQDGASVSTHYLFIANAKPTVAVTAPANNSTFIIPNTDGITVTAKATQPDADGFTVMHFWTVIGTAAPVQIGQTSTFDANGNGTIVWKPTSPGINQIFADVTDGNGATVTNSVPVTVTIDIKPTVTLTAPSGPNATVQQGAAFTVAATAQDANDSIAKVEFLAQGTAGITTIATVANASYQTTAGPLNPGSYKIWARATDTFGAQTDSTAITLKVNQKPSAALLLTPLANDVINLPTNVTMTLQVTDADSVASGTAVFVIDGTPVATNTVGTTTDNLHWIYTSSWTSTVRGNHRVSVAFTDADGGTTSVPEVPFTVNTPPNTTLQFAKTANTMQGLIANQTNLVYLPSTAIAQLTASDNDAADGDYVSSLTLNKISAGNRTILGNITGMPAAGITNDFGTLARGQFALEAVATDTRGATVTNTYTVIATYLPTITSWTRTPTQPRIDAGTPVTFSITAQDSQIGLDHVEIYHQTDGITWNLISTLKPTVQATKAATTMTWTWTADTSATHSFMAKAYNVDQGSAQSANLLFSVNTAPAVQWVNPTNNTIIEAGQSVILTANATDDLGIPTVKFYSSAVGNGATPITGFISQQNNTNYSLNWIAVAGSQTIRVTAADPTLTSSSTINVIVDQRPTASITAPANSATILQNIPQTIAFAIGDPDADDRQNMVWTITDNYANNNVSIASGTSPAGNLTASWANPQAGTHQLVLTVTDTHGLAKSSTNTVVATAKPQIGWVNLPATRVIAPTNTVTLQAIGYADAGLAAIEIHQRNGTSTPLLGTMAATGNYDQATGLQIYQLLWRPDANRILFGNVTIFARAIDRAGYSTESLDAAFTVDYAPFPTITGTTNNAKILTGQSVSLILKANDIDLGDKVTSLQLLTNNVVVTQWTPNTASAQSTYQWTPQGKAGDTVVLSLRAVDTLGIAATNTLNIRITQAPTVTWTAPADNQIVGINNSFTATVTASDIDGYVSKVAFYAQLNNGTSNKVGEVSNTTPPTSQGNYSINYSSTTGGTLYITAVAIDNDNYTAQATRTIRILSLPTITVTEPKTTETSRYLTASPTVNLTIKASAVGSVGTATIQKMWVVNADANTNMLTTTSSSINATIPLTVPRDQLTQIYNLQIWALDSQGQSNSTSLVVHGHLRINIDFNGDSVNDLLFQDNTTGLMEIVAMSATNPRYAASNNIITPYLSAPWTPLVVEDFNNDGSADILWMDTSGNLAITYLNGQKLVQTVNLTQKAPANGTPIAAADLNNDGIPDILFEVRPPAGGKAFAVMYQTAQGTFNPATTIFTANASCAFVGLQDADHDGKLDIVLTQPNVQRTANNILFKLNNGTWSGSTTLLNPDSGQPSEYDANTYQFIGCSDVDLDIQDELLLIDNTSGNLGAWGTTWKNNTAVWQDVNSVVPGYSFKGMRLIGPR